MLVINIENNFEKLQKILFPKFHYSDIFLSSSMNNLMKTSQICRSFCCHKIGIFIHPLSPPFDAEVIFRVCICNTHNQSIDKP